MEEQTMVTTRPRERIVKVMNNILNCGILLGSKEYAAECLRKITSNNKTLLILKDGSLPQEFGGATIWNLVGSVSVETKRMIGESGCIYLLIRLLEAKSSGARKVAAQAIASLVTVLRNCREALKHDYKSDWHKHNLKRLLYKEVVATKKEEENKVDLIAMEFEEAAAEKEEDDKPTSPNNLHVNEEDFVIQALQIKALDFKHAETREEKRWMERENAEKGKKARKKDKKAKKHQQNDQVDIQSEEVLKRPAALEGTLRSNGVFGSTVSKSDKAQKRQKLANK